MSSILTLDQLKQMVKNPYTEHWHEALSLDSLEAARASAVRSSRIKSSKSSTSCLAVFIGGFPPRRENVMSRGRLAVRIISMHAVCGGSTALEPCMPSQHSAREDKRLGIWKREAARSDQPAPQA